MTLLQIFALEVTTGLNAEARSIVSEAKIEAKDTMESMIVNEGQQSVYDNYILPQFIEHCQAPIDQGWDDIDAGEYVDFMGEIVEECNSIMGDAYEVAAEMQDMADAVDVAVEFIE